MWKPFFEGFKIFLITLNHTDFLDKFGYNLEKIADLLEEKLNKDG
jgi:hypothetical protein